MRIKKQITVVVNIESEYENEITEEAIKADILYGICANKAEIVSYKEEVIDETVGG